MLFNIPLVKSSIERRMRQFIIFIIVGIFNTAVGYGLFSLFLFLGWHYALAVFVAMCFSVIFNFKTIGSIVFKSNNKRKKNELSLLFCFIGVYTVLFFINILIIRLIQPFVNNYYVAGAMATAVMPILSFYLNKYVVFNEIKEEKSVA